MLENTTLNGWMLSWGDFHARTSAQPVKELGLLESDLDCGESLPDSLLRYDPDTRSWKTLTLCFIEGLDEYLETWPRSGMTRNGRYYRRVPLVRPTEGIGFSLWPTPNAWDGLPFKINESLEHWEAQRDKWADRGVNKQLPLTIAVKRWPTPTARDWKDGRSIGNAPMNGLLGRAVEPSLEAGALNPVWVEWLMGFPEGWTDLEDLETP